MLFLIVVGGVSLLLVVWMRRQEGKMPAGRLVLRAAVGLALARAGCVWVALLAGGSSGILQFVSYLLLHLTLPEAILARSLVDRPLIWAVSLSLLLAPGSVLWASLLHKIGTFLFSRD